MRYTESNHLWLFDYNSPGYTKMLFRIYAIRCEKNEKKDNGRIIRFIRKYASGMS